MSAFGDQLKEAREARGLSLEAVAEATRVAPHHLAALERSDLAALPAGPFAKGYIEACAKVLDVDPAPILEAYRGEARQHGLDAAGAQDRTIDELGQLVGQRPGVPGQPERAPGGRRLAVIALLLGLVGWLVLRDRTPEGGAGEAVGSTEAALPGIDGAPVAAATEAGTPPESAGLPEGGAPAGTASSRTSDSGPARTASPSSARTTAPPAALTATPTPTPSPAVAVANPNIAIPDSGVGKGVDGNRLVGAGDRFPEGEEVVFWTRVVGGDPGDVILHVWLHEGRGIARIPLRVGSPSWRTFSRRPLPQGSAGRWTAEARTPDGRLLARQEFVCEPPGP